MSEQRSEPRILVVEDETSIAEPFIRALERADFEVAHAPGAVSALELFDSWSPDLIVLDLTLPDGDGRDVCLDIRSRSEVPILMLTAKGTETDRVIGLELGADDYVVKPFSSREVISRIRAILRRSLSRPDADLPVIEIAGLSLDRAARRASLDGEDLVLSRKEFDLLVELMSKAGSVVSREDLMANVWDVNWFGSTKTLDVHIRGLRKKLGDTATDSRFIHTVRGVGFRFTAPGAEES